MQLNIRHPGEKFVLRGENEWPLARTQWTKFYLDPAGMALEPRSGGEGAQPSNTRRWATASPSSCRRMDKDTEITGPMAAKLFVSSSTSDADLFLIVRVFDPARPQGTDLHRLDRPQHADRQWLAARLAPPARSGAAR